MSNHRTRKSEYRKLILRLSYNFQRFRYSSYICPPLPRCSIVFFFFVSFNLSLLAATVVDVFRTFVEYYTPLSGERVPSLVV